jgi:CO dehydrogenase nickel-insertion accessory protein CooC1
MRLQTWDNGPLIHNTQAFIEHLGRLVAQGCQWLVVPLTEDESVGRFKCSKCSSDTGLAALYSIATHIAFEEEVLRAIKASHSQAEYEAQVSRIIEEEATPMVCRTCCPRGKPHRHDLNHAF